MYVFLVSGLYACKCFKRNVRIFILDLYVNIHLKDHSFWYGLTQRLYLSLTVPSNIDRNSQVLGFRLSVKPTFCNCIGLTSTQEIMLNIK